jgi:hypothetical protein
MAEHAITLTPAERDATTLVRVAQKCPVCKASGYWCMECCAHGFAPAPYQPGDVLVDRYASVQAVRLTVVSVELVREDGEWVWVYEVSK